MRVIVLPLVGSGVLAAMDGVGWSWPPRGLRHTGAASAFTARR